MRQHVLHTPHHLCWEQHAQLAACTCSLLLQPLLQHALVLRRPVPHGPQLLVSVMLDMQYKRCAPSPATMHAADLALQPVCSSESD